MRFYSGFGLRDESELFRTYLRNSDYTVAGFSKGAIEALEYTWQTAQRVDLLQLLSPAFFQSQTERFKRLQLLYFTKDPVAYRQRFLQNCAAPSDTDLSRYQAETQKRSLEYLLYYRWEVGKIKEILQRGVRIEVYLGSEDRIIDAQAAKDFFARYASVYYLKGCGHILEGER